MSSRTPRSALTVSCATGALALVGAIPPALADDGSSVVVHPEPSGAPLIVAIVLSIVGASVLALLRHRKRD